MSGRKKLCVVMGGHFAATIGGAQFQAKCVVDGFVDRGGYDIFYLARAINPDFEPDGYQIIQIAEPKGLRKKSFLFDSFRLLRLLKDIQPDVIYQRGLKTYTGVVAYYARHHDCQSVFHVSHDYSLVPGDRKDGARLRWLRAIEQKLCDYGIRHVDDVIAQSQFQADLLQTHHGRDASAVVPNFHPMPKEHIDKSEDLIEIVWVANFKADKQPEYFVELAEALQDRANVRFTMIGRPGDQQKYRSLHERIEALDNLEYLGERPIDEVNARLASAHLFVNTSRAEGFPNTFIQAWMRQVPVISLSVDPDDAIAKHGLGFHSGTAEALRRDIERLIDDPSLRASMGQAAQEYAFDTHSPKAVEKIAQVFDGVANHVNK